MFAKGTLGIITLILQAYYKKEISINENVRHTPWDGVVVNKYWFNSLVDSFIHPPLWRGAVAPGKCAKSSPVFPSSLLWPGPADCLGWRELALSLFALLLHLQHLQHLHSEHLHLLSFLSPGPPPSSRHSSFPRAPALSLGPSLAPTNAHTLAIGLTQQPAFCVCFRSLNIWCWRVVHVAACTHICSHWLLSNIPLGGCATIYPLTS